MTSVLNDTEKIVVETIRMRLTTLQALQYMQDNGFAVSRATYFRHKRRVEEMKMERVYQIAKMGFVDQHLRRIDGLEMIEKKMWQEYHREQDPYKRVQILNNIAQIQPYLSSYYEATKYVVDKTRNNITLGTENKILELEQKDINALIPINRKRIVKENQKFEKYFGKSIEERDEEEERKRDEEMFRQFKENFVF